MAQNDSTENAQSFAVEWSKLFEQTDKSVDSAVVEASNLPSQLLDKQEAKTTHFPNPFEEPMFEVRFRLLLLLLGIL